MSVSPTLKDLASAAGTSVATVSQALRNTGGTSLATRARIQQLATEMGYRPNPILASLASRKFQRTAVRDLLPLVQVSNHESGISASNLRYHEHLKIRFADLGYGLQHRYIGTASELKTLSRQWYHQGVLGLVFTSFENQAWISECDWSAFSVVMAGGRLNAPLMNTVLMDATRELDLLLTKAFASKAQRIGVVLHRHRQGSHDDFLRDGVMRIHLAGPQGGRLLAPHGCEFEQTMERQLKGFRVWFRKHRPDLVIGHGVVKSFVERTPEAVASHCLLYRESMDEPGNFFGTVAPNREIAARTAELLDSMIRHRERGLPERPVTIEVTATWCEAKGP